MPSTEVRRGVWFPLVALGAVVLGSVVEILVAPTLGPVALDESFGRTAYVSVLTGTGGGPGTQSLSTSPLQVVSRASHEYWLYAAVVCWLALLLWYRRTWPWWQVVVVGLVVPLGFVLGIVFVVADVTGGETGLTAPALLLGLAALAGGWARLGRGRGRWLGGAVGAALSASVAVAGLSAVLPTGSAVLLVGGTALAWFARSGLVVVTTVAAAAAVAASIWFPGPMWPAVVASGVLLLAAIASRHPRLRHV